MAISNHGNNRLRVTQSVFDRLIDLDPRSSKEVQTASDVALREIKQAVRRDLEWLLNSKQSIIEVPETLEEVNRSLAVYGLPDISGLSIMDPAHQTRLVRAVEKALKVFDPRFKNPKVVMEPIDSNDRAVRFRIEAILDIDPAPERVVFDTVLQPGSGDFKVIDRS